MSGRQFDSAMSVVFFVLALTWVVRGSYGHIPDAPTWACFWMLVAIYHRIPR